MARETGLSKSSVQRLWSAHAIAPHRLKSFKLSKDLAFEEKFWDVVGLYLHPPDRALLLCCDEKCQCQALERSQPGLPLSQGHIRTQTHDYYRHGTVTLFAALDYLSGKVFAHTAGRHRHQEWLAFLRKIEREVSPELDIHHHLRQLRHAQTSQGHRLAQGSCPLPFAPDANLLFLAQPGRALLWRNHP